MGNLFCYELRRLLNSKLLVGILLICLGYGWLTLTHVTVQGVANTAPFSPWSFGHYLSRLLPFLCSGELLLIAHFHSSQERRVRAITGATPINRKQYAALRILAVSLGTLLLYLAVLALCVGFYAFTFGETSLGSLVCPALLTLLPAWLFCLGAGWSLGARCSALLYGLMAGVFLLSWLPLPQALDFCRGDFFSQYPLILEVLDPAFTCPAPVLWGRLLWSAVGILLLLWSWVTSSSHTQKS